MNWFTGVVMYVLLWWVLLFAVLPFGTRPVPDADQVPGGWRGAPAHPHLLRTLIATSIVAGVAWTGCYLLINSGWIDFRHGWLALPGD